jgi:hypothetical protein
LISTAPGGARKRNTSAFSPLAGCLANVTEPIRDFAEVPGGEVSTGYAKMGLTYIPTSSARAFLCSILGVDVRCNSFLSASNWYGSGRERRGRDCASSALIGISSRSLEYGVTLLRMRGEVRRGFEDGGKDIRLRGTLTSSSSGGDNLRKGREGRGR